jgi:hypothetical protein
LNIHILQTSQEFWTPGRDLAIDKIIYLFQGRSFDILIIPGKLIEEGYKVWVQVQRGYFLGLVFYRKNTLRDTKKRGPLGL